jgi:hypothetical protein
MSLVGPDASNAFIQLAGNFGQLGSQALQLANARNTRIPLRTIRRQGFLVPRKRPLRSSDRGFNCAGLCALRVDGSHRLELCMGAT